MSVDKPKLPPLRTFLVRRYIRTFDGIPEERIEELMVEGHVINWADNGAVYFTEYIVDPNMPSGFNERIRRAFSSWIEIEEIRTPEQSVLIH